MTFYEINQTLKQISYPEYQFEMITKGDWVWFLRASYLEKDIHTGKLTVQKTRKWYISPYATKSEVVQTALKCILTSMEHRVREHFSYRGERIFGPHFSCDELADFCKNAKLDERMEG